MISILSDLFYHTLLASRDAAVLACAVGAIVLVFGSRIAPAWRHLLWLLVAIRLALPVLPVSPTSWQGLFSSEWLEVTMIAENTGEAEIALPALGREADDVSINASAVSDTMLDSLPSEASTITNRESENIQKKLWQTMEVLGLVWAMGFAGVLSLIGIVTFRFHRRLKRLTIKNHQRFAEIQTLLEDICHETKVRRVPKLQITEAVLSPALTGLFRSEILLPPAAIEKLSVSELRLVLLHELGHMRRRDVWTNWVLSILQAVHWFNPLIWWAFHCTRIEGERAADVWVLEHSGAEQAENYGQALIHLLKSSARPSAVPGVVGVIESRRDLRKRLVAIAGFTEQKSLLAIAGALALMIACAAIGLTQAPVKKSNEDSQVNSKTKSSADAKKLKSRAFSRRKMENYNFPYPSNQLGWANEVGHLSIWVRGDWSINLGAGLSVPLRFKFASVQDRISNGMLGVGWWVPLLESRVVQQSDRRIRMTTIGGKSLYMYTDLKEQDDAGRVYQTRDGKWIGVAKEEGWFDVEGPGGWKFFYREGRITRAITPSEKILNWNYDANKHVKSIVGMSGNEFLTVKAGKDGLAEMITVKGGSSFDIKYAQYPEKEGGHDEKATAGISLSASRITERFKEGGTGRYFTFDLKSDQDNKGLFRMHFIRAVPRRKPEVEDITWQAGDGLLKWDSYSKYEWVVAEGDQPAKIMRRYDDGTWAGYWYNKKTLEQHRYKTDGSSIVKTYSKAMVLKKFVYTNPDGESSVEVLSHDEEGRLTRVVIDGVLFTKVEYSTSGGVRSVKRLQKMKMVNDEDSHFTSRATYYDVKSGNKTREEMGYGRDIESVSTIDIADYNKSGRIVKVLHKGVVAFEVAYDDVDGAKLKRVNVSP